MYAETISEFPAFGKLSGDTALTTASIGNALARSGDRVEAISTLKELKGFSSDKSVPAVCFASVHVGLRDKDQAMAWLEEAYTERSDFLLVLRVDPLFDPLRSDLRFQDLLRRMGLTP